MAKKKSMAIGDQSQLKDALRRLKKLGLYNPKNPRKAPTRYAKQIARQYEGVLKGQLQAVHVPAAAAKEFKGQYRIKRAKKGATVIVPKAGGMNARYSKKEGTIVREAGVFELVPIKDRLVLLRGEWPKLKNNENVVVRIGNNYVDFYSLDEVRNAMAQYDPHQTTLWQYPFIARVKKTRAR